MSRDSFDQVFELFAELSPLTAEARSRIIAERGLPDSVREELEALFGEVSRGPRVPAADDRTQASAVRSPGDGPARPAEPAGAAEHTGNDEPRLPEALQEFGTYRLLKELGRGGQGVVFLAEDRRLRRQVALKMLSAGATQSDAIRGRFQREAEITSKLNHPGICAIHEVGEEQGVPFISMQYIKGQPLEKALAGVKEAKKSGSAPSGPAIGLGGASWEEIQRLLAFFERTARALHVAHEAGLVHRDIKPGNIMVTDTGDPILVDFGAARDLDDIGHTLTQEGQLVGTPAYMAPEQIKGDRAGVDRRADVYGLTATLYECLTLARVFEADSLDELFQKIQTKTPSSPRKLNAQVTRDLEVVIEVGLEREVARRYKTAEALADDLRRVAEQQAVRARAAGVVRRLRKWARANPTRAVAAGALLLFLVSSLGFWIYQEAARAIAVRRDLQQAEQELQATKHDAAFALIAKALARDPGNSRAMELHSRVELARVHFRTEVRKAADLVAAGEARAQVTAQVSEYGGVREELARLRATLGEKRRAVLGDYASEEARGAFAAEELKVVDLEIRAEALLASAREALERSLRLEAPWMERSPETFAAFADFFMVLWREAVAENNYAEATALRDIVVASDPKQLHERELLGRGTLAIHVVPEDAELYLFRYESREAVLGEAVVPRLVPVPTTGVLRSRASAWVGDFHPGDLCLEILAVEPGSRAEAGGLRRGDFVVRLNGLPCGNGLFLRTLPQDEDLAKRLVPWERVRSINDVPIDDPFDWGFSTKRRAAPEEAIDRILFGARNEPVVTDKAKLDCVPAVIAVRGGGIHALQLLCLRDGEPIEIEVPAGGDSGLRCESTAYPLLCSPENRVSTAGPITADPGSYLVVARRAGFETQRFSCVVPRLGEAAIQLALLEEGSTPPGFVYVPPGEFTSGGDPEARPALPASRSAEGGYFIARREVTNAEWFEFVNDPATLAIINAKSDQRIYLPREPSQLLAKKREDDGTYEPKEGRPETAVFGISYLDAAAYVVWRNARAQQSGERWEYALPTGAQWEKAARACDGRPYPWGSRFDPGLTVGRHRKDDWMLYEPAGIEPCDESPYGVRDLAGSRYEWTIESAGGQNAFYRSGSWFIELPAAFRAATRYSANPQASDGSTGLRLVAHPRRS